jgi:hypothetical protein
MKRRHEDCIRIEEHMKQNLEKKFSTGRFGAKQIAPTGI